MPQTTGSPLQAWEVDWRQARHAVLVLVTNDGRRAQFCLDLFGPELDAYYGQGFVRVYPLKPLCMWDAHSWDSRSLYTRLAEAGL